MCGTLLKEEETNCSKCGTKIRVDRRLRNLPKKEPEKPIQKPNLLTKETLDDDPKGFLSKRKQRYLERRKKFKEELSPEVEAEAHEKFEIPSTNEVFPVEELPDLNVSQVKEKTLDDLDLSDIDLSKLEQISGIAKEKEMEFHKLSPCKNCGSLKGNIIYCPYCGKQFCLDCAAEVESKDKLMFYTCPFCSKKVIIDEKA
jgi:DNA-directed RNA polymerase subunit RPC12/RpoP